MHQVNVEYLARVVMAEDGWAFPDICLGTDSHTTMVNGLGVLAWGIGGIEAEAVMLGRVAVDAAAACRRLPAARRAARGRDRDRPRADDHRAAAPRTGWSASSSSSTARASPPPRCADRVTIANMSPEFGSTCAYFPIDEETLRYLRFTGRPEHTVELVEAYAKAPGPLARPRRTCPQYTELVELDLATVVPSLAGPRRPQDRVPLDRRTARLPPRAPAGDPRTDRCRGRRHLEGRRGLRRVVPRQRPAGIDDDTPRASAAHVRTTPPPCPIRGPTSTVDVTLDGAQPTQLDHGAVAIAAITSCTNTSNPTVMVAAGLLAKNAVDEGSRSQALGQDQPVARARRSSPTTSTTPG